MRWFLSAVLALGLLWCLYWFVGSRAVQSGVTDWFASQSDGPLGVSNTGVSVAGFPNRFDLTVTEPAVTDAASGVSWHAPFVQVFAMTWKPWHLIAVVANDQAMTVQGQQIALHSDQLRASLLAHPTTDLRLDDFRIEGHGLAAVSSAGWKFGAQSLAFSVAEDPTQPDAQRIGLTVSALTPDPELTALMPDLGGVIDTVYLDATVLLTAPIDRNMALNPPQVVSIALADFHANWGSLKLAATGKVQAAADGLAEGKIDFKIDDWRQIPKILEAAGVVNHDMAGNIANGLKAMALSGPDPNSISLPLIFKSGRMLLGPLPLGLAPRLRQRQ